MLIHLLLLHWALSILGATVSDYAIALKVAKSSSSSLQVPYVGHECMGTTKYQKMCWIIIQTQTIIWVSRRETNLIVVQYMEYELELMLHSLQSVKKLLIALGYIIIIQTATTVAIAPATHIH